MSGNPVRAGLGPGVPLQHGSPAREGDRGEKAVLEAIRPDGKHQRSFSEVLATLDIRRHRGQSVNGVLRNIHRVGCQIVGVCVRDTKCA